MKYCEVVLGKWGNTEGNTELITCEQPLPCTEHPYPPVKTNSAHILTSGE